jgi:CheY-like chemotaxis protein
LSINPDTKRLALLTLFDTQRTLVGLENLITPPKLPAWKYAEQFGIPEIESILLAAMQHRRDAAAIAAIEFLGATGRSEILASRNGQEAPLLQALRSADIRTRFVALQSIMQLETEQAHAGSQFVMETIRYFLHGHGERKVLIGHPRLGEAERLAALFNHFGYSGDATNNGSELLRKAQQHGDYEMILLSDTLDSPSVFETMQMIRQDFRAVRTPIGVMVTDHLYERGAKLTTRTDPLATMIAMPQSLETATWQLQRVTEPAASTLVSAELRANFTLAVLNGVIKQITSGKTANYMDFREIESALTGLIHRPPFNAAAMQILGSLATPKAQLALVEYASLTEPTHADRMKAVEQFASAVKKRGLFLTKTRIQQQFDLYNSSEQATPETIEILGNLLDAIEAPSQQRSE